METSNGVVRSICKGTMLALCVASSLQCLAQTSEVFVATVPYEVTLADKRIPIDLGGVARTFDFGGAAPFVNPTSGVSDIGSVNVWSPSNRKAVVLNSSRLKSDGVPGRLFKAGGYTAIGYVAGDDIVEGKLRTQINSFPIPSRQKLAWELNFRLGGATIDTPWTMTPRGIAPATLWQVKTTDLPPALVMAVDTDPKDPSKLELNFDTRLDPLKQSTRIGQLGGLDPNRDFAVHIEALLDERSINALGKGYLRITVNGQLVVDRWGPTVQSAAVFPYHWSLAMYLYANTTPLTFDRFVYFKTARMVNVN